MGKSAPVNPSDPADHMAFAAARDMCRRYARGFYFASSFLPRAKRDAACSVVAFCGMVRDAMEAPQDSLEGANGLRHHPIGAPLAAAAGSATQSPPATTGGSSTPGACSSCDPSGSMDARVGLLRERLDEIYDGRVELPRPESRSEPQHALHAFTTSARRHQIPPQYFVDLADALRRDETVLRYATWASLERQCRQGAGSVALALSAVFGVTHSGAGEHALQLATAMRLTTVLRDLRADRDRGKVCLPLEDLARFRYSERDLARCTVNDPFRELIRFEIARARGLFRDGAEGLCWLGDDGSRLTVSALAANAAGLLDTIERQGCDLFTRRPALSAGQKLRRLPVAWSLSRRRPGERMPDVFRAAR